MSERREILFTSREGIFYHQGTTVVEKSFTPTWVGALQFCIYLL